MFNPFVFQQKKTWLLVTLFYLTVSGCPSCFKFREKPKPKNNNQQPPACESSTSANIPTMTSTLNSTDDQSDHLYRSNDSLNSNINSSLKISSGSVSSNASSGSVSSNASSGSVSSNASSGSVSSGVSSGSVSSNASSGSVSSNPSSGSVSSNPSSGSVSSNASSGSVSSNTSSGSVSSGVSSGSSSLGLNNTPTSPFAGLSNLDNKTCYMNATIQVFAVDAFKNLVAPNTSLETLIHQINTNHFPLDKQKLEELISLFPKKLNEFINKYPREQEDPDELIHLLVSTGCLLLESIQASYLKDKNDQGGAKKIIHYIDKLILHLDLNDESDLSKIIASNYTNLEQVKNTLQFSDREVEHDVTITSDAIDIEKITLSPPNQFYINLKRQADDGKTKIEKKVSGTENITIKGDLPNDPTIKYNLHAFIVHSGKSSQYGHYIAYVKREGKWYEANDDKIKAINEIEAVNKSAEAYLLFYKKE